MPLLRSGMVIAIVAGLVVASVAEVAMAQRFVPKNRGLPGRREGSGTRGACLQAKGSVVALMPSSNSGLTVSEYPMLSWYVPATQATTASFVLLDEQQREVYSTMFQTMGRPGMVSLSLPQNSGLRPLEVGKRYRWKFAVTCDGDDPSSNMMTEGWLQRVEMTADLKRRLQGASAAQQVEIFAAQGIWYDAAGMLLQLRRSNPTDPMLAKNWQLLLDSVMLKQLETVPIAPQTTMTAEPSLKS